MPQARWLAFFGAFLSCNYSSSVVRDRRVYSNIEGAIQKMQLNCLGSKWDSAHHRFEGMFVIIFTIIQFFTISVQVVIVMFNVVWNKKLGKKSNSFQLHQNPAAGRWWNGKIFEVIYFVIMQKHMTKELEQFQIYICHITYNIFHIS